MKNMFLLSLIVIFFFTTLLYADNGTIKGRIVDSETGEALPGANVAILGTGLGAATDLRGNYTIGNVPPGEYTLKITYIGYKAFETTVQVLSGRTVSQDVELQYGQVVEGQLVTVTAQASGQYEAINQQLRSNTIANVVSKARIKQLPDVNAAESIGRLPGVSIERSGGEATKIAIRGLSPKYNTVTVNGVRVPATGEDDRSVDLSLISSNMLDGIEVKKAITPDMDADALGGTVDLLLKEAPEQMEINFSGQGGYNQLQSYYGNYNFTGNVARRFFDSRLGFIASFNLDSYDRSADKFDGDYGERTGSEGETEIAIESLILREETVTRRRGGASFLLDYRLPTGKITANSFYNRLSWDGLHRIDIMSLTGSTYGSNRHHYDYEDRGGVTNIFTGGIGIEQDFDWIRFDAGVARTSTRTNNPNEHTWRFTQESGAFTQTEFPTGTEPTLIPEYATNDTFLTRLSEAWIWDTDREENETSFQFNLEMPFRLKGLKINGSVKTGAKFRWLDRVNDVEYFGRHGIQYGGGGNEMLTHLDEAIPDWGVQDLVDEYGWLPISIFLTDYSRSNFLDGDYPVGFTVDMAMMKRVTEVLDDSGDILRYAINSMGSDYEGIERYQAGYLMTEFDIGKYVTFLTGIRYEKDYSEYTGYRFREQVINNIQGSPADLDTLKTERDYDFWLPMVHLGIQPADWLKIRFARTESLTRPDFTQYAPITRINNTFTYMRAANTQLKPAQSINWDGSVSVYENHLGLFTVSGFIKDIDDLIFQTKYNFKPGVPVHEGLNIPDHWLEGHTPESDIYINNDTKAKYKGFELEWQTHFWYLPSFLKGLVLNVNYTRIFSEIEKTQYYTVKDSLIWPRPPIWSYTAMDSARTARMPDQPSHIANITIGYDFKGFSARLSYLYQTDKVTYIDRKPILDNFSGAYARWDLTIRQKLGRSITLFANFTNLNNRPDRNYQGVTDSPTYIEYYGFTMDGGIRYSFY